VPYADIIENAHGGYAQEQPDNNIDVAFSDPAKIALQSYNEQYPKLKNLIEQVLSQDPRPAYKQKNVDDKIYGMTLYDLNIQWQMSSLTTLDVIAISKVTDAK
jgi:hypothetical protein